MSGPVSATAEAGSTTYCVEDNGKGIPTEYLDKIFDLFTRLEPDTAKGEGLGLTIARRMIERQGGKIWVNSEVGEGSKFYIPDHVRNFLDAVKSRQDPIEPVEIGHRTATLCHLGNIAMRLKRKIRFDPATEQIPGDQEAQAMLARPMRPPWHL